VPVGRVEAGRAVELEALAPAVEPPGAVPPGAEPLAVAPAPAAVEPADGPDGLAWAPPGEPVGLLMG